ncbi:PEP-CTERM sorting domain-containing protein [Capsulimonas corticalis]|nr:PEP-CTERM sorting domain-containing protein [Capsulimonas corticalis]
MAKLSTTAAIALTIASFSVAAHADQTITFTGLITGGNIEPLGVNIGDTVTESYTVKSGATDIYGANPTSVEYLNLAGNSVTASVQFDGYTITNDTLVPGSHEYTDVFAQNGYPALNSGDILSVQLGKQSCGDLTDINSNVKVLTYDDPAKNPLTSLNPVIKGPGLTDFSQWQYGYFYFEAITSNGDFAYFNAHLTNISSSISRGTGGSTGGSTVPEPSPIAFLSLGVMGVFALAARKRKSTLTA